jgi:hypothetical protein
MITTAIAFVILHLLQRWKNWWLTVLTWVFAMVLHQVFAWLW